MPGHLVLPLQGSTSLRTLAESLRDAHRFLVAAARATVPRLLDLPEGTWGASAKREHVVLATQGRPSQVSADIEKHSFVEIVNQCATLERLIDALAWVQARADMQGASAVVCNPTTSSAPRTKDGPRNDDYHDLVLQDGEDRWKFEVSDVAGGKDGNGKEKKDLISLGVLPAKDADVPGWPSGRSFLVVSSDFAERLRRHTRHGLRLGLFHYEEVKREGDTRIFEVRRGPAPASL